MESRDYSPAIRARKSSPSEAQLVRSKRRFKEEFVMEHLTWTFVIPALVGIAALIAMAFVNPRTKFLLWLLLLVLAFLSLLFAVTVAILSPFAVMNELVEVMATAVATTPEATPTP